MLLTITLSVLIIVAAFVLFHFFRNLDDADKGMAGSLTSGAFALIAAIWAWHLVSEQLGIARQQANVALSEALARQVSQIEDIRRQLNKLNTDLDSAGFDSLNPLPLGLTPGAPRPEVEKFKQIKESINAIWLESDALAAVLAGLRNDDAKKKVEAYITSVKLLKVPTDPVTRVLDAMVKNGPQGGPATERYDPQEFSKLYQQLRSALNDTTITRYINAENALSAAATRLSKHLQIIDQSLDE